MYLWLALNDPFVEIHKGFWWDFLRSIPETANLQYPPMRSGVWVSLRNPVYTCFGVSVKRCCEILKPLTKICTGNLSMMQIFHFQPWPFRVRSSLASPWPCRCYWWQTLHSPCPRLWALFGAVRLGCSQNSQKHWTFFGCVCVCQTPEKNNKYTGRPKQHNLVRSYKISTDSDTTWCN